MSRDQNDENGGISVVDWVEFSGERDPNMTNLERKLVKSLAYLGLKVYLYMGQEKQRLKNIYSRLRLLQPPTHDSWNFTAQEEFCRTRNLQITNASRRLAKCEHDMYAMWNYLFDLPANFERLHPDGSNFILALTEADGVGDSSSSEEEEAPIADVSVGSSFDMSSGEKIFIRGQHIVKICFRTTGP